MSLFTGAPVQRVCVCVQLRRQLLQCGGVSSCSHTAVLLVCNPNVVFVVALPGGHAGGSPSCVAEALLLNHHHCDVRQ